MMNREELKDMPVTVMGLGLNGGGLASARFLAREGALVTVTDLRDRDILAPTIKELEGLPIRYVLGRHEEEDFRNAAMVIKNPAVTLDSPYLKMARRIETDLSLFLMFCPNPILAVTGSKGKSTTVSALHHILKQSFPGSRLGGNITISPLSFLDQLNPEDPVVLELSSWQLADLRGKDLLHPEIAVITNIMHDHQNRYESIQDYIDDKLVIYSEQKPGQKALMPIKENHRDWPNQTKADVLLFSTEDDSFSDQVSFGLQGGQGWFRNSGGGEELLVPDDIALPGRHLRGNLLIAASMARLFGIAREEVVKAVKSFPGVPHRMELCGTKRGVEFYNDTAATIPDALVAAVESFKDKPVLICGGTDKNLDFSVFEGKMQKAKAVILLKGSATDSMMDIMDREKIVYQGPYGSLKEAFDQAVGLAEPGDRVILSPGATSFGMFLNEFDRGNQFKALVDSLS